MRKIIVAGGRDFKDYGYIEKKLKELILDQHGHNVEIVHGNSMGCDQMAERFARENDLEVTHFTADWDKYGKAAGPKRNYQMSRYGDYLIVFPGGRGTKNMIKCMEIGSVRDLEIDYQWYLKKK